ncbi:DUF2357 domain-containing protein [Brevibacillus humidisoli]|uniref:DUF2357 domain-containing protein n=1 Tax=Brevibacillus humidisoli TaxID=2895522 RepID=UPI001E3F5B47|nr:DUF2357 domain-containing protein [Brevibacillus humidisoli]UFJ40744.1 DUF2357 domain-containing protein [Brevibacillus humidisoli]
MDTQYNERSFRLVFYTGHLRIEREVTRFYPSEEAFYENIDKPSLSLIEHMSISIRFESDDPTARLYMYGLDTVEGKMVEEDENFEAYLSPSSEELSLFTHDSYPLIPGVYQIRVHVGEQIYYAPFVIHAKGITNEQLTIMRQELEETIRGLALDLIRKRFAQGMRLQNMIPPELLYQFMVLKKHYEPVMAALNDLYTRINFRNRKEYKLDREDRAGETDDVTIRHMMRYPGKPGYRMVPYRRMDYDLPENRWVKQMIRDLIVRINEFEQSIEHYRSFVAEEISGLQPFAAYQDSTRNTIQEKQKVLELLDDFEEFVRKVRASLNLMTTAHWYEEIADQGYASHVSHVLISDSRYRALYQMYRDFRQEELTVDFDPYMSYQWKRSDILYEMWGFTTLLKLLIRELGFTPTGGWLFSQGFTGDKWLIPHLPEDAQVRLQSGDLSLTVTYNSVIPLTSDETDFERNPLYMTDTHNRPDTRINFYLDGIYAGTLLIDYKYRPRNNFWDQIKVRTIYRSREMNQLIAYGSNSRSKFIYGDQSGSDYFGIVPVYEAWAIYPVKDEMKSENQKLDDFSLRFITMSPGLDNTHVVEALRDAIEGIRERMARFHRV